MEKGVAVNGTRTVGTVEPVVIDCHLPAGMAGPSALSFDVRCFVCPHDTGVVLVDTGTLGSTATISTALNAIGTSWDDVSDVVLTHAHFDHTGGLLEVADLLQARPSGSAPPISPRFRCPPVTGCCH